MLKRLEKIRKKLLQFSNFWFRLEEKTRHVVLIVLPLLAAFVLTTAISIIYSAIQKYSRHEVILVFCFFVISAVMFVLVWLFAIIMDERRKIEEQACRDCLTGVYTRRYVYEEAIKRVAEASRTNKTICVCFVDVDNLKPINDEHSHAAGDEALILIGKKLLGAVRINDLVGRYGGDEFLLIWTTDDMSAINETFKRINDALGRMAFRWHDKEIVITASTGLSHGHCEPKSDPEKRLKDLIRQADDVLKGTKKYKT